MSAMEKTIEKSFFNGFEATVSHCISFLEDKYDLGYFPKDREQAEDERLFFTRLQEHIIKKTEEFDDSVIIYSDSPLMDEIERNLSECKTTLERDNYIFSLLKPFKQFSDTFNSSSVIKRLESEIERYEQEKKFWEENEDITDLKGEKYDTSAQAAGCINLIKRCKEDIERRIYRRDRLHEIICGQKNSKDTVEYCLEQFLHVENIFANKLDWLLLQNLIELKDFQKESGIYLKSHRIKTDLEPYAGSIELVEKYIDELKIINPVNNDSNTQNANDPVPAFEQSNSKFQTLQKEYQQEANSIDYEELRKELAKYIFISKESLRSLVEYGTIEPGASATWNGRRADAYRFARWLSPDDNHFKNVFNKAIKMNGSPLRSSDGDETKGFVLELSGSIFDVLKKYNK